MRYSRNGVLDMDLRASVGRVLINHRRVTAMNYDGSFPGPTMVICTGDRLIVHLKDDLSEPTNLQDHGFHVSPSDNHDNVFVKIDPGQSFTYEYDIPQRHAGRLLLVSPPPAHASVEPQIFGGLAGVIVQEGGLDTLPALRHVPQRWIILQNTEVRNNRVVPVADSSEGTTPLYVNGAINPTAKIRPGQLQRWRIFNADADRIVVLRLPGRQRFLLLAEDGHTLARPLSVRNRRIRRRGLVVRSSCGAGAPAPTASRRRRSPSSRAARSSPTVDPCQTRRCSRCAHPAARIHPFPARTVLSHPPDLRRKHVDRKRTIVFSEMTEASGNTNFLLNGMTFDPNRTDITMKLGSVQQWTLVNSNEEWHTFHIHTNDFQVVSVNGRRVPYVDYYKTSRCLPTRTPSYSCSRQTSPASSCFTATSRSTRITA